MGQSDSVLEMAAKLRAQDKPFALVTVVRCESPASAKPGDKAVVDAGGVIHGWIGGGCAQPVVTKMARRALAEERPVLVRISPDHEPGAEEGIVEMGMVCHSGGTLDIFIDPINPQPALLIIGATPAAQTLCALASRVGFDVTAAFPGATQDMFADAQRVVDGLAGPKTNRSPAFVVVATQGKKDEEGLEAALSTNAGYVAFIASERKATKLKQYLRERGYDPGRVEAIVAPAGVEISAVTPDEIALSVLAALVKERRKASARPADASAHARAASAVQAVDPVCKMTVDVNAAEYKTEFNGKPYYFCSVHCLNSFEKSADLFDSASRQMNRISAIVLAAGESRRMGAINKLLMPVGGVPMLRRVLDVLTAVKLQEIIVVLGHEREQLLPLLHGLDVRTVVNERFREGQMSSVWAGMSALSAPCDGVMICLGDQPLLTPGDIAALIEAFGQIGDRSILVPVYHEQRGNPIILSYKHRDSILAADRNLGCKRLIERNPELVATFETNSDHFVLDIDTPEGYESLLARVD